MPIEFPSLAPQVRLSRTRPSRPQHAVPCEPRSRERAGGRGVSSRSPWASAGPARPWSRSPRSWKPRQDGAAGPATTIVSPDGERDCTRGLRRDSSLGCPTLADNSPVSWGLQARCPRRYLPDRRQWPQSCSNVPRCVFGPSWDGTPQLLLKSILFRRVRGFVDTVPEPIVADSTTPWRSHASPDQALQLTKEGMRKES